MFLITNLSVLTKDFRTLLLHIKFLNILTILIVTYAKIFKGENLWITGQEHKNSNYLIKD